MFAGLGAAAKALIAHHAVTTGVDKAVDVLVRRTNDLITANPRQEVTDLLRRLEEERDPAMAQVLWRRLEHASAAGVENLIMIALGRILPRDSAGKIDYTQALDIYEWLAAKNQEQFDLIMEAMKHDPIVQFFHYWVGKRGTAALQFLFGFLGEVGQRAGADIEAATARWLPELENFTQASNARSEALKAQIGAKFASLRRPRRRFW